MRRPPADLTLGLDPNQADANVEIRRTRLRHVDDDSGVALLKAGSGVVHRLRPDGRTRCGSRPKVSETISGPELTVTCQSCVALIEIDATPKVRLVEPIPPASVFHTTQPEQVAPLATRVRETVVGLSEALFAVGKFVLMLALLALGYVVLFSALEWVGILDSDKDCADFDTQSEAQRYYAGQDGDPDHLDMDYDGIACERLP